MSQSVLALANQRLAQGIQNNPFSIELDDHTYWVKRRAHSKQKIWHQLQHVSSFVLRLPILKPTVSQGGPTSLLEEAARLQLFKTHGICVPNVIAVTHEMLITQSTGETLHSKILQSTDETAQQLMAVATKALSHLHQQRLVHGRPSSRDLLVYHNEIYFIDLEEDPEQVMSQAQAQARDLWLFFNNMSRYCQTEQQLATLFKLYEMSAEVERALKQLINRLHAVGKLAEVIANRFGGRDLIGAVKANRMLEHQLV